MQMRRVLIIIFILLMSVGVGLFYFRRETVRAPEPQNTVANRQRAPGPTDTPSFNKQLHSLTDTGSLWVVVNKDRPIPLDFVPADLVTPGILLNNQKTAEENQLHQDAATAAEQLFADAAKAGHSLMMGSGYRSAKLQAMYYNNYVARDGQAAADRYSAKPGTSEHQTGLSLDIARADRSCYLEECFADTAEGAWLAAQAHHHGFILRYPPAKEASTGYQYEPWHFRYVGKELALELFNSKKTIEEYFEL